MKTYIETAGILVFMVTMGVCMMHIFKSLQAAPILEVVTAIQGGIM